MMGCGTVFGAGFGGGLRGAAGVEGLEGGVTG